MHERTVCSFLHSENKIENWRIKKHGPFTQELAPEACSLGIQKKNIQCDENYQVSLYSQCPHTPKISVSSFLVTVARLEKGRVFGQEIKAEP